MGVHGVGRVVFAGDAYTRVVPTIYDAVRGTAYFRAPIFGELARRADGHDVSLNVDDVDPCGRTRVGTSTSPGAGADGVQIDH